MNFEKMDSTEKLFSTIMKTVIRVESVSKQYRLGNVGTGSLAMISTAPGTVSAATMTHI
jgi:hypothetical protein